MGRVIGSLFFVVGLVSSGPFLLWAQSINASLSGTVFDESGGVVPGAELTLTYTETGISTSFFSDDLGRYSFQNLTPGTYNLRAVMPGFREYVHPGIELNINVRARVNITLKIGTTDEQIEVVASPTLMNFENPTREAGINPDTLDELPLLMEGQIRSAAGFALLLPGVTSDGGDLGGGVRFNGGTLWGDEAIVDGVTMQQGTRSQSGMISLHTDFPFSPDMVSELKVLTANYEPQFGGTTGAVVIAETKSGTQEFHGSAFWFHGNSALNASPYGQEEKPYDNQHSFGGAIGGPVKLPGLWSDKVRSFFYFDYEGYRLNGSPIAEVVSIPSLKNRQGDFTDWTDSDGNLIPIFDPLTTRFNPAFDRTRDLGPDNLLFFKDQFMGCDGNSPNVICSDRIADSWARYWFKYLPEPTWDKPLDNYQAPPVASRNIANYFFGRLDMSIGEKEQIYLSVYHRRTPPSYDSVLPPQISSRMYADPDYDWVNRLSWTHTFTPNLINHFGLGYLNKSVAYGSVNHEFVEEFPKVPGVAAHSSPPTLSFRLPGEEAGFEDFGSPAGNHENNSDTRPALVGNNLTTWVKGAHVFKFGAEYRSLGGNGRYSTNEAGTFFFLGQTTGLFGITSGSPIASFLLEAVTFGTVDFRDINEVHSRQKAFALHFGDTWQLMRKLSFNIGLRWDVFTPAVEKYDRLSFFDPTLPNPAAGGRLGALAFADEFEARMGRRHPEETWYKGFAPRLGLAWSPDDRTVVRAGYGIFIHQAYCPGWGDCMAQDGYVTTERRLGGYGGLVPAFLLREGFPRDFRMPPDLEPDFRNGQSLMYRPFEANRRSYSQQWNLTAERDFGRDTVASVAYVGTVGRRLPSQLAAINVLPPEELSRGEDVLIEVFKDDDKVIAGVAAPYEGWVNQMKGCEANVAQALLSYPQYCDQLQGLNENAGNSSYHSVQVMVNRRFSSGLFFLGSYTFGKLMTDSGSVNESVASYRLQVSPFERRRAWTLALDDVPHVLSLSLIYDLPWQSKPGFAGALINNWTLTSIFRASSGLPFAFSNADCDDSIPPQFRMKCLPAIVNLDRLWAKDKDNYDPGPGDSRRPLFNKEAFEEVSFDNPGTGSPLTGERGFGFVNHDLSLLKRIAVGESVNFQFRAEFFNLWNWHTFGNEFDTNLSSLTFGEWNREPSLPRRIQFGLRLEF
jgi:hypothetical protein